MREKHSFEKPVTSKELAHKEETAEMKESRLIVDGKSWALSHFFKKPVSSKELASKEEIAEMKES
eukprot:14980904-Ditylum_brightwellii.AAC.1